MKIAKTYSPTIAAYGEAEMSETPCGHYVRYSDYMELYKKYIRARATVGKNKIKSKLDKSKKFE